MKVLVDNVAAQVVEDCFLTNLSDLLSPTSVLEIRQSQAEREQLVRKIVVLRAGFDTCKRYVGLSTSNHILNATVDKESQSEYIVPDNGDCESSSHSPESIPPKDIDRRTPLSISSLPLPRQRNGPQARLPVTSSY